MVPASIHESAAGNRGTKNADMALSLEHRGSLGPVSAQHRAHPWANPKERTWSERRTIQMKTGQVGGVPSGPEHRVRRYMLTWVTGIGCWVLVSFPNTQHPIPITRAESD